MSVEISSNSPAEPAPSRGEGELRPKLTRGGILLGDRVVPLLSGSVHYFRLEPQSWRACLESLRDMGCTVVDVYVPWSVHEDASGQLDFGRARPELDVASFLRIAEELGLFALVRPGPHINAELSGFGLPERVLWDPDCQARSPGGHPVVLPMPPLAFPVPSYASRKLIGEACAWLRRVGEELGPLAWPRGPIVLCQVDNEGAMYFRDGVFEQDYHPDSIELYRRHLQSRYSTASALSEAYGVTVEDFELAPPRRFEASDARGLRRQLDWAEYQEASIADAFGAFRRAMSGAGLERVPTCHNLPMGESATPLDPTRLGKVVECLGMDYYHVAAEASSDVILKRTSEVTTRADAFDYPSFAVELAAGFPPFFPPLTQHDNRFAALSCLAAGVRGFNLYMAVERDRWIGSPIDRFGAKRDSFEFWSRLNEAVKRTRLHELSRAADVCVVVPRSLHRLERLLHAFGPISAAAFDVMGLGAYDSCREEGPFAAGLFEAERFLRALLRQLSDLGVCYRVSGNDSAAYALARSRFGFVVTTSGLERELWRLLDDAALGGAILRFGPTSPRTSPSGLEPLPASRALADAPPVSEAELGGELARLLAAHQPLCLPAGSGLRTSLFRDLFGAPRVLFVTNTTPSPAVARLESSKLGGAVTEAVDALDGATFRATFGTLEAPLSPQSVRMLELR